MPVWNEKIVTLCPKSLNLEAVQISAFLPPLNLLILKNLVTVVQVLIAGYFSTGHLLYLQQTYAKPSFEISLLFFLWSLCRNSYIHSHFVCTSIWIQWKLSISNFGSSSCIQIQKRSRFSCNKLWGTEFVWGKCLCVRLMARGGVGGDRGLKYKNVTRDVRFPRLWSLATCYPSRPLCTCVLSQPWLI